MKNILNKLKDNWILLFILIQPILDMIYYFQLKNNLTPLTWLIRIISLALIVLVLFFKSKNKKKISLLIAPFALYFVAHMGNLYRINSLNLVEDIKYFIFVFMLPVLTILFIDYIKERKEHIPKIEKGLFYAFIAISISLFLAFITNTYQCTYVLQDACVGLLGWFFPSDTVFLILCALAPFAMYYSLKKGNLMYAVTSAIAFLILYTNASKSCYITLVLSLIVIIYIILTNKDIEHRKLKAFFTVILLGSSLYLYDNSLTFYRQGLASNNNQGNTEIVNKELEDIISNGETIKEKDKIEVEKIGEDKFLKILSSSYIYQEIIDIHGAEAVLEAMDYKLTPKTLSDNRYRKVVNAKIEFNKSDTITKFLGFGYSKIASYSMDLENDLEAIFFFYGYIGFGLYVLFFVAIIFMLFKLFIKKPSIIIDGKLVILVFLMFLTVAGGEYTGAFLRRPNSNIFLVMYLALMYFRCEEIKNINNDQKKKTEKNNVLEYFDKIYSKSSKEFYKELKTCLKKDKKTFIITANPETFTYGTTNDSINNMLLDENALVVPDGIGIVKSANILGYKIKERIPGIEIAEKLLELANKEKKSIYLFGAKQEVLDALIEKINVTYPNINVLGATDGYVEDKEKVMKKIIKLQPDICLVALGIPLQEELIYKYLDKFEKGIFVGVGGSFDVMSGVKKRAPKFFQKFNLEWLYRILKEPKRLGRFWNNNVMFIYQMIKYKCDSIIKEIDKKYFKTIMFFCMEIAFLFFIELINHYLVTNTISLPMTALKFSLIWINIIILIVYVLSPFFRKIFVLILNSILIILTIISYFMYNYFHSFFSFKDLFLAKDGLNFISSIFKFITPKIILIVIFLLAFTIVIGIIKTEKTFKLNIVQCIVVVLIGGLLIINLISIKRNVLKNMNDSWDSVEVKNNDSNYYSAWIEPTRLIQFCGTYEYLIRDFYKTFIEKENINKLKSQVEKYLKENSSNNSDLNYNGIFNGKNLIFVMMESEDDWMVNERVTPTIYKMLNHGFNFINHYSPGYVTGDTANTEFIANTGLYPSVNKLSPNYAYVDNSYPFSIANLFKKEGYSVNSFHRSNGFIYNRGEMHLSLGYEKYHNYSDMDIPDDLIDLDSEIIKNAYNLIVNDSKFMSFIITYTPHDPYNYDKIECTQNLDEIKKIYPDETDEEVLCSYSASRETDNMFKLLLEKLTKENKLDDTIIVGFSDHRNKDISPDNEDDKLNKTVFFIYDHSMDSNQISTMTSSINILPTIINLFGIKTNYVYPGYDALNTKEEYVLFKDYTYFNGIDVLPITNKLKNHFDYSTGVLVTDYYE